MKDIDFYIEIYFNDYLPKQLALSKNTIISYSQTIIQLIKFFDNKHLKFKFDNITDTLIEEFLLNLETEKNISISTRNQKLACIHSLFKFIQKKELSCYKLCSSILTIKNKKTPIPIVTYMSTDEIKKLLSTPNLKDKNEYRDFVIITILYETGARVQEVIDLKLNNLRLSSDCSCIELTGKGNKSRLVPINNNIKKIIERYIYWNNINYTEELLFKNKYNEKFTRKGIQYIIDKYISKIKKENSQMFNKKISPHSFRHTKAMHLLEAGVNLIYIRDILGHTSVTTTEIYAKTNPKIKQEIIEKNSQKIEVDSKYSENKKTELLQFLSEIQK